LCAVYFLPEDIWCVSGKDFEEKFYPMIQIIIKMDTGYNYIKILIVLPDKNNEISGCVKHREEKISTKFWSEILKRLHRKHRRKS